MFLLSGHFFNPNLFPFYLQTEIVKRLNALISQLLPFLAQEHQQQVHQAVERAKQITVNELNAIIGVSRVLDMDKISGCD